MERVTCTASTPGTTFLQGAALYGVSETRTRDLLGAMDNIWVAHFH